MTPLIVLLKGIHKGVILYQGFRALAPAL